MGMMRWSATIEGDDMVGFRAAQPPFAAEGVERIALDLETDPVSVTLSGGLVLLAIRLDRYDADLSYQVNGAGTAIDVTGPQIFSGGAIALLGSSVTSLDFAAPTAPVQLAILAARDATA
jgi:hypothetical protein